MPFDMIKYLTIILLLASSSPLLSQIWKYPNVPYGFENMDNLNQSKEKKEVRSEMIVHMRASDTIYIEKKNYDVYGRLKVCAQKNDTLEYTYGKNGFWESKTTNDKKLQREFVYNKNGQLEQIITLDLLTIDTVGNCLYEYANHSYPVVVKFQNGNHEERDYYEDGKLKIVKFYNKNVIRDSIFYSYSADTVRYDDCSFYKHYDKIKCSCESTYGLYDAHGNVSLIVSLLDEGDELVEARSTFKYDESGKPIVFVDSLSNGSIGKELFFYDEKGDLERMEIFSEGETVRTIYVRKIE